MFRNFWKKSSKSNQASPRPRASAPEPRGSSLFQEFVQNSRGMTPALSERLALISVLEEQRARTGATGYAQPDWFRFAARAPVPSPVASSVDIADNCVVALDLDDNASELSEDLWLSLTPSTRLPSPVEVSFDIADNRVAEIDHDENASECSEDLWLSLTPSVKPGEVPSHRPIIHGNAQASSRAVSVCKVDKHSSHSPPHDDADEDEDEDEERYRGRGREPKMLNPCAQSCSCALYLPVDISTFPFHSRSFAQWAEDFDFVRPQVSYSGK